MTIQVREHIAAARELLDAADRRYAAGDRIAASEMLWGAASPMIIALSQQRGLPYRNRNAMKNASRALPVAHGNPAIAEDFEIAEKFHRNFYPGDMDESLVNAKRPRVRILVETLSGLA